MGFGFVDRATPDADFTVFCKYFSRDMASHGKTHLAQTYPTYFKAMRMMIARDRDATQPSEAAPNLHARTKISDSILLERENATCEAHLSSESWMGCVRALQQHL
jgi:hypothetical protein